jgi:hypothetical protein
MLKIIILFFIIACYSYDNNNIILDHGDIKNFKLEKMEFLFEKKYIYIYIYICFVNVKTDPRLARVLFCHQMSIGTCGQAEAQPQTS